MQVWPRNKWRKCCSLKLDRSLCKSFLSRFNVEAQHKLYLSRITKSDFLDLITRISLSICVRFLFSQLDIYKDYFKGRHKVMQKNNTCNKCPSSPFSLKKLLHLYTKGFVTKELPDLHCWWSEELCSQHLL